MYVALCWLYYVILTYCIRLINNLPLHHLLNEKWPSLFCFDSLISILECVDFLLDVNVRIEKFLWLVSSCFSNSLIRVCLISLSNQIRQKLQVFYVLPFGKFDP